MATAKAIIEQARAWLGRNEKDGSFKAIIDLYNGHKPLPQGYKVKYTDSWCACFVSACAIACGADKVVPLECSCQRMIDKAAKMGVWVEDDKHVPAPGEIILYDWQDSGSGDATGWADHVGLVEACDGKKITVIEGNKNDAVERREIAVNGRYIRGFICPKYEAEKAPEAPKKTVDEIAREVINGKWGVGADRKNRLTAAGYDYNTVQARVNELCGVKRPLTFGDKVKAVKTGKASSYGTGKDAKQGVTGTIAKIRQGASYPYLLASADGSYIGWYRADALQRV